VLRFKVTPPVLPACVDRPRLLGTLLSVPVVALAAPGGHGKTCLAAQVAAATGGPTAWFTADELDRDRAGVVAQLFGALGQAWRDLGNTMPPALDDDAAVPLLGSALETLAGPGCLVLDDVHLLPEPVLDAIARVAIAALPSDMRLVICTRAGVPEPVLRAEAMGRAASLGPAELAFDEDECRRVCGSAGLDADLHARTGGWPLAVGLSIQAGASPVAERPLGGRHIGALADLALADLTPTARELMTVLARLPCFPARLLARLGDPYASIERFGRDHPTLLSWDNAWWWPREWLRDALSIYPADGSRVASVARALVDLDEPELAAQILLSEARYEEAVPLIERLASQGIQQGRPSWVRSLIASVPSSARTFTLDLLAATAAHALNIVDPNVKDAGCEQALLALVERAAREGEGPLLRAQALLAGHYRMQADSRLFVVCEAAVAEALASEQPEAAVRARWSGDDMVAAAELLRLYGHGLLFSNDREVIERGQRLIAAALNLLDGAGRPTVSQRPAAYYVEVLLFLKRATEVLRSVRLAAHRMAELEHGNAAMRLAELATVEYLNGDHRAARRTIELARDRAERTGNRISLAPLAAIEVGLDVWERAFAPEHGDRFDQTADELEAHPRLAPVAALITAEFGIALARNGRPDVARRYLDRAEASLGATLFSHTTSFRCRRLRGLVLLAEGAAGDGRAVLEALRRDAADEGRTALVDLIDADLADGDVAHAGPSPAAAPVVVHVLAPELSVSVNGDPVPAPRGYPAKLLALLVASAGVLTVDAAIEGLWPEADPTIGRNRLHGVLLRLRRGLGLPVGGPISCTDGLVRLERSPLLEVDSWEFERAVTRAEAAPEARIHAALGYRGDVLSGQFAYDDTVTSYRRSLRRQFLRLAMSVLDHPPVDGDEQQLASLARRAWSLAPEDDTVCRAVVGALGRLGHRAEACELVAGTARALDELGLDGEEFHRAALASLPA
jgi:DNA-binding SARP family transcriptional activator